MISAVNKRKQLRHFSKETADIVKELNDMIINADDIEYRIQVFNDKIDKMFREESQKQWLMVRSYYSDLGYNADYAMTDDGDWGINIDWRVR